MTVLVPIAMFGWIAACVALFLKRRPQEAVVAAVIGGFLLLPAMSYDFPGPKYTKTTSIALGLILGGWLSGQSGKYPFTPSLQDLPMLLWCFVSPVATSLLNGLGLHNGLSDMALNTSEWGVCYWAGRKYFSEPASLRVLAKGIALGGLLYFPAVIFEVRMSPQLSNIFYGFFPHSFAQTYRYGGFRPIVFMNHGLMVALWMAVSATVMLWLWRGKALKGWAEIPQAIASLCLFGAALLCKSANGWFFMALGILALAYFRRTESTLAFRLLLLAVPAYIALRISDILTVAPLQSLASTFFDADRTDSLGWRLLQENLFAAHARARPWFGWGGYDRFWPVDPATGERLIQMVDSFWIITYSCSGLVGLGSAYLALGLGPWRVLGLYGRGERRGMAALADSYELDAVLLSLVVCFFMLDSLLNSMFFPVYILCSGALTSQCLSRRRSECEAAARPSEARA